MLVPGALCVYNAAAAAAACALHSVASTMRASALLFVMVCGAAILCAMNSSALRGNMLRSPVARPLISVSDKALSAAAAIDAAFIAADVDGDGKLNRNEFSAAMADDSMSRQAVSAHGTANVTNPGHSEPPSQLELPQCSIVFFFHIVKTAGTTMRTVLQRQAQLGEFEYVYTDTTSKPRWQLIMHQFNQSIAPRRIIVEIHSEWGLRRSFFADVRQSTRTAPVAGGVPFVMRRDESSALPPACALCTSHSIRPALCTRSCSRRHRLACCAVQFDVCTSRWAAA